MKNKTIYLKWEDASSGQGWYEDCDIRCDPWLVDTIGYVCKENKKHISLTTSVSCTGRKMDVLTIPKACILKRRNIKI